MNKSIKYTLLSSLIILFYFFIPLPIFLVGNETTFVCVILLCFVVEYFIESAKSGEPIYMRPIAAIKAMEEAVGRATEMGTPVLYVPGISSLDQIDTISGLTILGHVAGMTAEYEANLHVPVCVPIVMETAKETCKESYLKKGRPDLYRNDMVHYVTDDQFAYAAGVNGIMVREKPAACMYMGKFYAESLILAETGNSIGAIQIAGTASQAQIPFFVTACDYTLIGEEFFAASAYLSQKPELIGGVKGQDMIKLAVIAAMVISTILMVLYESTGFGFNISEYLTIR